MARNGLKIVKKRNGIGSEFQDANGNKMTKTELVNNPVLRDVYDVSVARTKDGTKYIRSNPDQKKNNNLE